MDTLRQDLRFALRLLWKDRAFALTAILTLAICIGANTAIFAVVRSVLLRPLPYPEPIAWSSPTTASPARASSGPAPRCPTTSTGLSSSPAFESQALYQWTGYTVGQGASAEGVAGMGVTPSFFDVLGRRPSADARSREAEGPSRARTGRNPELRLLAARLSAGATTPIGRDMRLNGERYAIVGVMPRGIRVPQPDVAIWTPLAFTAEERSEDARYSQNHEQIARLASGATRGQAQQQVDALTRRATSRTRARSSRCSSTPAITRRVVPLEADIVRDVRRTLHLLWGGVLFVLLIAAANITNLVLVRASGRMKELATRHALGAGHGADRAAAAHRDAAADDDRRSRSVSRSARWRSRGSSSLGLSELPRGHEIRMDWMVVAFTFGSRHPAGPHHQRRAARAARRPQPEHRPARGRADRHRRPRRTGLVRRALVDRAGGAGVRAAHRRRCCSLRASGSCSPSIPGFRAEHVLTGHVGLPDARYARRCEAARLRRARPRGASPPSPASSPPARPATCPSATATAAASSSPKAT